MNSLVQGGIEDARHLPVAHIVTALVGVGGNQRAVGVDILAVDQHGELVALAVNAQGAVAGVVKNNRVAPLRHIHEILLHGGQDAIAIGLCGRQNDHSGAWACGGAGLVSRTTLLAGKANLGLVSRSAMACASLTAPSRFSKASQLTAAVGAAGGMLRLGAFGLVGVDADDQGALGLRRGPRSGENAEQDGKNGNIPFHMHSGFKNRSNV